MKVVIVECRERRSGCFESDISHVSSSWELAIAWMGKNPDWSKANLWWWVAYEYGVDSDEIMGCPRFFDPEGVELPRQPFPVPVDPAEA